MRRLLLVLFVCALVGCKKDTKSEPGSGKPAESPVPPIALVLDGNPTATIDAAKVGAWAPLGSFLPSGSQNMESWGAIELRAGARVERIDDPSMKRPGLVAAVFPARGGPSFGFFAPQDLAKKGRPQWEFPGVTEVVVKSRPPEPPPGQAAEGGQGSGNGEGGGAENEGDRPAPSANLKITIVGPAGEKVFTGDKLAGLPTTTAPVGDTETPGWTLGQILDAVGTKPKGKLVVYGEEGANLILERADLDPAKAKAFIKLNRSGQLRFRLFRKTGATWDIAGELRGLARVELK